MTRQILYEWFTGIFMFLFVYFEPVQQFFLTVTFFVLADTILGVIVVIKNEGCIAVRSWGLWRMFSKITSAGIFLMVAFVVQKEYLPSLDCLKIVGCGLIIAELKSLDEKAMDLYGISLYKSIIDKLTKKVKKEENDGSESKAA